MSVWMLSCLVRLSLFFQTFYPGYLSNSPHYFFLCISLAASSFALAYLTCIYVCCSFCRKRRVGDCEERAAPGLPNTTVTSHSFFCCLARLALFFLVVLFALFLFGVFEEADVAFYCCFTRLLEEADVAFHCCFVRMKNRCVQSGPSAHEMASHRFTSHPLFTVNSR